MSRLEVTEKQYRDLVTIHVEVRHVLKFGVQWLIKAIADVKTIIQGVDKTNNTG